MLWAGLVGAPSLLTLESEPELTAGTSAWGHVAVGSVSSAVGQGQFPSVFAVTGEPQVCVTLLAANQGVSLPPHNPVPALLS